MPRIAAIDCGTNSIRLLVCDIEGDTQIDLVREMRIVRLGQGVDHTGRLADEAIERTVVAATEFARHLEELAPDRISFCATSAVRDASNADQFSSAIEAVLGVRPRVLDGDEEARASFDGATRGLGSDRTLVVDIGGGSTEIVIGHEGRVDFEVSLDVGSVRLSERFLHHDPPSPDEIAAVVEHLDGLIGPAVSGCESAQTFVGVAGTVTTVAAHALHLPFYDHERVHLAQLRLADVREACRSLVQMPVAERRALPFMHPGRADVIGAGALVLERLVALLPLATDTLVVSERDILDGIAWAAARQTR